MSIEDLKRLRDHVDVAIGMMEVGGMVNMTAVEMREFKYKFGDADAVIGDFIIRMTKLEHRVSELEKHSHPPVNLRPAVEQIVDELLCKR